MAKSDIGMTEQDAVAPAPLHAPLFHELVEHVENHGRSVILDLGSAHPRTVALFNQFRCRLEIADLAEGIEDLETEDESLDLSRKIESLFPARRKEPTDVILCWDLLNYLRRPVLTSVMEHIADRAQPGALAHALVAYAAASIPAIPNRYFPSEDHHLMTVRLTDRDRESPRYTHDDITRLMPRYKVKRAMLLKNGMQEFLFRL